MKIPESLMEAAANRTLVPFVGAGVSRNANLDFPTWKELVEYLFKAAILSESLVKGREGEQEETEYLRELINKGQYVQVAGYLKMVMPDDVFREVINRRFD